MVPYQTLNPTPTLSPQYALSGDTSQTEVTSLLLRRRPRIVDVFEPGALPVPPLDTS